MPHRPPQRHPSLCRTSSHRGAHWLIPPLIALLSGCAHTAPPGTHGSTAPEAPKAASAPTPLAKAAERQRRSPDAKAVAAPPPPSAGGSGLPTELANPLQGDALAFAAASLDEALAALPPEPPSPDPAPTSAPTENERLESLRAYVVGRAQRLAGEDTQAEASLKQAVRLDPNSAQAWRELAIAQASLGNRGAALTSFRQTLALDPADFAALDALSRAALDRGEWADAARLLQRLRAQPLRHKDAALPAIVAARLARALEQLGRLAASVDAMRDALELPDSFSDTTQYHADLGLLYRQRGDLWRDAGDSMLRLDNPARAAECYANAAGRPALNPSAITPRRVYALMRQGRSADAASILIDDIRKSRGRADDRALTLLAHVAGHSSVGPAAADAIDQLRASLDPADARAADADLIHAKAACLPANDAVRLLLTHLRADPTDDDALRNLFARLDHSKPRQIITTALDLIDASAMNEGRYTRAALVGEPDPSHLLAALPDLPRGRAASPSAVLFKARLLEAAGDLAAAEQELIALHTPDAPGAEAAAIAARISILWRLGRADDARALAATLNESQGTDVRDAKVLALTEIGDYQAALDLLSPRLPPLEQAAASDFDRFLLAARLNLNLGEYKNAERILTDASRLDPARDEPYAALLNLYSRTGPLASESGMIAAIRALRDNCPSSPTLRFLRAQEALQRGQLDFAERDLLDLSEESPVRQGVVEGLVRLWKNLGRDDDAEAWLRERAASRPDESVFTIQLAALLDARRKRDEAVALLEARLARMPGDDDASRALESLLRSDPSQRERAQALARARLARAPKTAEALIELAEVAASSGSLDEAADAVRRARALTNALRPDAVARLTKSLVDLASDALKGKQPLDPVLAYQRAIVEAATDAPPGVYIVGIQLLARTTAPLDDIYSAIDQAIAAHPSRRTEFYSVAWDMLASPGRAELTGEQRPNDAFLLVQRACETTKPPPARLHAIWVLQTWLTPQSQDFESLARAIQIARDNDSIDPLLDELLKNLHGPDGQAPDPAEALYEIALAVNRAPDRRPLVDWLYRAALRINPEHLWVNNNLGYSLLEEDRDIDLAVRCIETAHRLMLADPAIGERASIVDSLGWARYKQGVLRDELAPDGTLLREGAVSLLKRSYEQAPLERGNADAMPIITNHYADALWAAGDREQAVRLWNEVTKHADDIIPRLLALGVRGSASLIEELQAASSTAREKIDAATNDKEPPIARIHTRPAEPPAPAPPTGMIQ